VRARVEVQAGRARGGDRRRALMVVRAEQLPTQARVLEQCRETRNERENPVSFHSMAAILLSSAHRKPN